MPWLTIVLLLPLGTAVLVALTPRRSPSIAKALTIAGTLATAVIVGGLLITFARDTGHESTASSLACAASPAGALTLHFSECHDWIPALGAAYHLGIDGVAAWFLGLNALVFLLGAVVVSARSTERLKFFCALLLITEAATAGVIMSIDLLLFYLFWEAMLIPLYFLLGTYGTEKRGPATLKFIIYTVAGSLFMLLAISYLYIKSGAGHTFDLQALLSGAGPSNDGGDLLIAGRHIGTPSPAMWCFLAFSLAFAIKVPLVPFHTWLPDSYEAAPPAALTFFAGIVSKLGVFGFIRYSVMLFPQPARDLQWLFLALALLSILYGAVMALGEVDIKRIVAYSSVSHLGFIVLGIFVFNAAGLSGAVIQVVNHGVIIAGLFLVVGMIEARTGTRDLRELGGLEKRMKYLYGLFLVITLAGLGMPGLNSFVGEFTIMLGAWRTNPVLAIIANLGVVLAAWYMLRLHQGLMHEPLQPRTETVRDLRAWEGLVLAPLVAIMVFLGVYPHPVTQLSGDSIAQYDAHIQPPAGDGSTGSLPAVQEPSR